MTSMLEQFTAADSKYRHAAPTDGLEGLTTVLEYSGRDGRVSIRQRGKTWTVTVSSHNDEMSIQLDADAMALSARRIGTGQPSNQVSNVSWMQVHSLGDWALFAVGSGDRDVCVGVPWTAAMAIGNAILVSAGAPRYHAALSHGYSHPTE